MTSREPSNPVVHRLVAAINDGDRDAFLATLTPDATLTDDGNPRSLRDWIDREIFSARGHMNIEREESADGADLELLRAGPAVPRWRWSSGLRAGWCLPGAQEVGGVGDHDGCGARGGRAGWSRGSPLSGRCLWSGLGPGAPGGVGMMRGRCVAGV